MPILHQCNNARLGAVCIVLELPIIFYILPSSYPARVPLPRPASNQPPLPTSSHHTPSSTSPFSVHNQTFSSSASDSPHYASHIFTCLAFLFPPSAARFTFAPCRPEKLQRRFSTGRFLRRGRGRSAFRVVEEARSKGGRLR